MIGLYGLTISIVDVPSSDRPAPAADIRWLRHESPRLEDQAESTVSLLPRADGMWTQHVFASRGRTACEFVVSPDGRDVVSTSLPWVAKGELLGLFAEPVMRTIFLRRGIVSFHGTALQRDGKCILVLGAKGAGKSTLAAALLQHGWSLVTDDLARTVHAAGRWSIAPGFRQLKLSPDAVATLGYSVQTLKRRWSGGTTRSLPPEVNKRVLSWDDTDGGGEATFHAIYALARRAPCACAPRIAPLPLIDRFRALVSNVSDDPLDPASLPPREAIEAVGSILRQVDVRSLALPDDLTRVVAAAAYL